MREIKNGKSEARQAKRNVILAALAKASGEAATTDDGSTGPDDEKNSYYTLTREEVAALVTGNIEKIESWVSNLDRPHATWLLRWLIKESR